MPELPQQPRFDSDFNEVLQWSIANIPAPEDLRDPYDSRAGVAITWGGGSVRTLHPDGRIEYGSDYTTRQLRIARAFDLIMAYNRKQGHGELVVIKFIETGGVDSQTIFKKLPGAATVIKNYKAKKFAGIVGDEGDYFNRELDVEEVMELNKVMIQAQSPELISDTLEAITTPTTQEEAAIAQNTAEREKRTAEFRKAMKDITDAERRAAAEAHTIVIY